MADGSAAMDMAGDGAPFVLALGDSLTAGYGLAAGQSFASRLEALLRQWRPGATVHNAGVSGDTTADALRRLPRVLSALARRPHLAIVELGPNDLLRGVPPARTRASLDAIVAELRRCAIPVLLATFEPPPLLASYAGDHALIHGEVAARHGAATVPFFPAGVFGHPAMVLPDRVHPNARAIELVAAAILPAVQDALQRSAVAAG